MKYIKKTFISLAVLLTIGGGTVHPDTKLTSRDRLSLSQGAEIGGQQRMREIGQTLTATVLLGNAKDVAVLEEEGFVPVSQCGRTVILAFPRERLDSLENLDCVTSISLSKPLSLTTDRQRSGTTLESVSLMTDPHGLPFTGRGVVTGIFDQGFDYHHVNFLTADNESRIKRAIKVGANGKPSIVRTATVDTDTIGETHGTHVLGIMAGGYRGNLEYASIPSDDANEALRKTGENPFYGVAYESDIAVASGELYAATILTGINSILNWAERENKPAVVNLSVGLQEGPHDGTGPEAEFMSELGKKGIIVVAAGNDGLKNNCITKRFTDTDCEARTLVLPDASGLYSGDNGYIDIWAAPGESPEVSVVIYDIITRRIVKEIPLSDDTDRKAVYMTNSDLGDLWGTWHDEKFDQFFTGSHFGYVAGTHKENNRKNWYIQYGLNHSRPNVSTKLVGFVIKGSAGGRTDIYHYSETTQIGSHGQKGWSDPTADGTINDFACADNVLVVGSYNNRAAYPMMSGRILRFDADKGMDREGDISGFSSWGARLDGERLPHVCAPGSGVISSYSTPYVEALMLSEGSASGVAVANGRDNYWWQESGTSMAAPFVAGVVALWLQAAPDLTIDQVKEIVEKTSIRDLFVCDPDNALKWGAGKIDPEASLRYVLQNYPAAVDGVVADRSALYSLIWSSGREFQIWSPSESSLHVSVYTITGAKVLDADGPNGMSVSLESLPKGSYIITAAGSNGVYSHKVML